MTDADYERAIEVDEHNKRERERAAGYMLATHALGLDVPDAESVDAEGRWRYDPRALEARVAGLGKAEAEALVVRARAQADTYGTEIGTVEILALARREAIRTDEFRVEIAALDDPDEVRARLRDVSEDRAEIECLGRHWDQDERNRVAHDGLSARERVCEERLAELEPAPAP